jgi:protein subunit release factor B
MSKLPLFSITAQDCDWSYTRGTGNGGQKKNKTSSAVHCKHRVSGAYGYSETSRSQLENRRDAFRKMSETSQFQNWVKLEFLKRSGQLAEIEHLVEREMKNVKLEIKINGKWTEVQPYQLVDNPEDFVIEVGTQ